MKKLLLLVSAVAVAITLAACAPESYEIALVTDIGTIDDGSFNQGAWEGVKAYGDENDVTYTYYTPAGDTTDDYIDAIELAIATGAETVVCPGYLFGQAVWQASNDNPDVNFILLDATPSNVLVADDPDTADVDELQTTDGGPASDEIFDNVLPISYAEEQSGFLAGYAAVKEGFTELGFIGGVSVPAVVRFGYGFVQGANQAAVDMGLADDAITINYWYSNVFWETTDVSNMASSWYTNGTEAIFVAAGGAGTAVMTQAETATTAEVSKWVFGVDVDQAAQSDTVITSAMKELSNSVYDSLASIYDGTFAGGAVARFDVDNDGVGLPEDFSRFTTFTATDYAAIYDLLVAGTVTVDGEYTTAIADVNAANPKVNLVEVQ